MDEITQCVDQKLHLGRRFQQNGNLRNDRYSVVVQVIGYLRAKVCLAREHGDVLIAIAVVFRQITNDVQSPDDTVIRLVFSVIEFDLHQTYLLFDGLLSDGDRLAVALVGILVHPLQLRRKLSASPLEEGVIERDHVAERAVVIA